MRGLTWPLPGMLRQSEKESASVHEGKIYNWATGELLGTTGPFYDKVGEHQNECCGV